jgi:hypothetical protein
MNVKKNNLPVSDLLEINPMMMAGPEEAPREIPLSGGLLYPQKLLIHVGFKVNFLCPFGAHNTKKQGGELSTKIQYRSTVSLLFL